MHRQEAVMPVNPKPDRKCEQTVISTIPVVALAAMAIGAIIFPFAVALVAMS